MYRLCHIIIKARLFIIRHNARELYYDIEAAAAAVTIIMLI